LEDAVRVNEKMVGQSVSRRALVRGIARMVGAGAVLLVAAGCSASPATPTAAPAAASSSSSGSAAAPTSAPAATAAPAAPATPTQAAVSVAPTLVPTAAAVQTNQAGFMRPTGTPKKGGTLRNAVGWDVPHFDIDQGSGSSALCNLYNNLVRRNLVDGLRTIIPDLAVSWTAAPDSLSYTFKLRQGVTFHDGTPFSADDVVATFSRRIFPPSGIVSVNQSLYANVSKVEKLDDATIQFSFKQPQADFLPVLADVDMVIYSKKTLDANNQDLRKVVAPGTGAFMYQSYKQGEKWTMVRNPHYWDPELPYLDGLELINVPAWPDRGTAVLTNQSDMSWNVAHDTWLAGQKKGPPIVTGKLPDFGAYVLYFNTKKKPWDNPLVRRAVHLATSRQDLIQAYITQEWIDLTRWVPHGDQYATPPDQIATLPGYRADKTADIAEAKKLMAQAGYPNGFSTVDFLCASVAPHSTIMAPAIQDQLKRTLNINAKIRVQERQLLGQQERAGTFDIVLDTPGGPISDFSPIGNLYFKTGGSQNFGHYSNAKFDDLLGQSDAELDSTKRHTLLNQIQDQLDTDPPWLLIGYTFHQPMWRNNLQGLNLGNRIFSEWGRVEIAWLDPSQG
jgi:peptide/nickel transport system substrate-binding protein